ncbi:MAG TPA: bifunctional (p)ppGpp synthetase/guanosine-3',5'-bis(diphosphate) 3'-pyrophosphohydrolase [Ktedonobacteraceae bacterium]
MVAINSNEAIALSQITLEHLLAETSEYLSLEDLQKIQDAFELAQQAHTGVARSSGEPYILHPLEVALLLADMRIDADGIASALLHDVVEDTDFTLEELRTRFGEAVANIVDGVTKFDALALKSKGSKEKPAPGIPETPEQMEQRQRQVRDLKRRQLSETVRKMLLAMAEDPRVVVLKLADRLHNMRTLSAMNPTQQQSKARETREIYAPLARRLGMILVQAELEDLVFSYLEPEQYTWLAREVEEERVKRESHTEGVCQMLRQEMQNAGIKAEVYSWQKHLSSLYGKLKQNNGEIEQIHDLVSFRILVNSVHDCYLAMGYIHALWRPTDGRIRDFIAIPKVNGYQSLHTTVFGLDNRLTEIQIRTHEMQRTADYGIASYWYMKDRGGARLSTNEMIAWIEQLRDWQRELPQNADEFVEAVKGDIFQEQIFVFTPKGEVKDLPRGSTPLDLAYRVHSDIGDHCAGARIVTNMEDSGRLVTRFAPLDYELKSGEIVDIIVNPKMHPTRDWLNFAHTSSAKNKIRRYLKTYEREVNLQLGRERVDLALKAMGANGIGIVQDEDLTKFLASKKYITVDDLYLALGRAEFPVMALINHLAPILQSRGDFKTSESIESRKQSLTQSSEKNEAPLIVVNLAHCCCPLPGDAITGTVNPNRGIIVHRSDCRTLRRYRNQESERLIDVNWLQIEIQHFLVPTIVVARDRPGLLRDVAAVVSDAGINITAMASTTRSSLQRATITATLEITQLDQIDPVYEKLKQVKNVVSVARDLGRHTS